MIIGYAAKIAVGIVIWSLSVFVQDLNIYYISSSGIQELVSVVQGSL